MKKKIAILGSTGSIGLSSLKIIDLKREYFKVELLAASKNYKEIINQINKYKPKYFIISDVKIFLKISNKFKKHKTIIKNNFDNIILNKNYLDFSIMAIPGLVSLMPTLLFIKSSKKILLANKESIICAWKLIKDEAYKHNTKIIPIDSEHFSIMKLIENEKIKDIKNIYITASGGPFLKWNLSQIKKAKLSDAIKHPKWNMGKKISIDSATMMNKVFEYCEAKLLFSIPSKKLKIIIHPQSLVHAIVEFNNGISKILYHEPNMIVPIFNAIFDSENNLNKIKNISNSFDLDKKLEFFKIDKNKFPVIKLIEILDRYPSAAIIVNGANEIFVDQFIKKNIKFIEIIKGIFKILKHRDFKKYAIQEPNNLNKIYEIDNWSRVEAFMITMKK